MNSAVVYLKKHKNFKNKRILNKMKKDIQKLEWKHLEMIVDQVEGYDGLLYLITNDLEKIDVVYVYDINNIHDDFYWELLVESAKIEEVIIKEYVKEELS